jgi:hypothetical protein
VKHKILCPTYFFPQNFRLFMELNKWIEWTRAATLCVHFPTLSSLLSKQQYNNRLVCNILNTAFSQDLENVWIYCPSQCKLMGWHHLKIQGARRVTWSNFCNEDPQILGAIIKNLLSRSPSALDLCTLVDVYLQTCKQGLFKDKMITLKDLLIQGTKCLSVFNFPWTLQANTSWCLTCDLS